MTIKTAKGTEGHGLTFTCGRGNEIVVAAVKSLKHLVVGLTAIDIYRDFAGFWRNLTSESQLRWVSFRTTIYFYMINMIIVIVVVNNLI